MKIFQQQHQNPAGKLLLQICGCKKKKARHEAWPLR
jgi:hypothetical protein